MGPTASGKTDLAIALSRHLPCEVVSVDSALVYRGMDVGTAKPTVDQRAGVPHHMIDIVDPAERYSVGQYLDHARAEVEGVVGRGNIPLLAGGTMLYFRALQHGLADLPNADQQVRAALDAQAGKLGWPALHHRLAEVDSGSAQRIHPNDAQRIQRALEVYELTGVSLSELLSRQNRRALPCNLAKIVVAPSDRSHLHRLIEQRFTAMLAAGLVDEVAALRDRSDMTLALPSMRAVGYRQVWQYLDGEFSYDQMVHHAVVATRRYAKRQFTWLRAEPDVAWFESHSPDVLENVLNYATNTLNLV